MFSIIGLLFRCRTDATLAVAGLLVVAASGCNRALYRQRADCEVYGLVECANRQTRTPLEKYTIRPDVESRFFDADCPDLPPMPPDDPVSHRLMHCVDGKRGWRGWACYGKTPFVENPAWQQNLPLDESGALPLDRGRAVELALINSRDYQSELENLYLSALAVTYQRFRLDAQFFGGNSTFFTSDGPARAGSVGSLLQTDTDLVMQKLFATGGELMVGMANSLVWQFAGPDEYTASTLLDFSLVQPLLRAGGREVVLEALTDSERALLANIRQMERYRRGFYAEIVTGRSPGAGPAPGGLALAALSGGGGGAGSGILSLLEEQVRIRNQRANVAGLHDSLEELEAAYEAGRIDRFQVDLARQALYNSQSRLLGIRTSYQDRLDSYKLTLGLPPELEIRIEDPLLARFELIDPRLSDAQSDVADLLDELRDPDRIAQPAEYLPEISAARRRVGAILEMVRRDVQLLEEVLPERRENLAELARRDEVRRGEVDRSAVDLAALERRAEAIAREFLRLDEELQASLAALEALQQQAVAPLPGQVTPLVLSVSRMLMGLALVQAEARLDTITLVPIELDSQTALMIARQNRRDWRNARAALVDSWRQIEVAANDLQSGLDVTFSGDLSTLDDKPFRFRGTTGRLRVGLEFDAPLTRLAERNVYRETLINYQRSRRAYYAFEDRVSQGLRTTLRAIHRNQLDFELQRAAVHVAISQVDLTQLRLQRPPKPGEESKFGATTARDLVTALSGLLNAQNEFLGQWVDYERQRLNLDFDLGTMILDAEGMWIDPGPIREADLSAGAEQDEFEEIPLPDALSMPEPLEVPQ